MKYALQAVPGYVLKPLGHYLHAEKEKTKTTKQ
jgi:hypothetical protein